MRLLPAAYAERAFRRGPVLVTPGLRADGAWIRGWARGAVDPRLAARWDLGPGTTLSASAGGYSQFPEAREVLLAPTLGPERAWQLSAGGEQRAGRWSFGLTAFHHTLRRLVSGQELRFRFLTELEVANGPYDLGPYANDGGGRIHGLEGLARFAGERTAGWVAVTWCVSRRQDRAAYPEERFTFEQPLVLVGVASHALPRGWRLGTRLRYTSGVPYDEAVHRYFDFDRGIWQAVTLGPDLGRTPAFASWDVRVDKRWSLRTWTLALFLDVQNVTNRRNIEFMGYASDYTEAEPVYGLPIFPALGLRGEW